MTKFRNPTALLHLGITSIFCTRFYKLYLISHEGTNNPKLNRDSQTHSFE